jgi:hypothetical protein
VLGVGLQNVQTVGDGLIELFILNEDIDLLNVVAQGNLSHLDPFRFQYAVSLLIPQEQYLRMGMKLS